MEPNDLELLRAAASGSDGAFHALIDRHAPVLLRVAFAYCGNHDDAEDICQETLVAAFRGMKSFAGRSSVKTWLTQILIRRAAKHWHKHRHARTRLSLQHDRGDERAGHGDPGGALAEKLSVRSTVGVVDQQLDVMEMIRSLPPQFRETIVLREIRGLSYQEIADCLGIARGTVESRLHRARAELRRKLTGY